MFNVVNAVFAFPVEYADRFKNIECEMFITVSCLF